MADRSSLNQTTPVPAPSLIPLGSHLGKAPIGLNRPFTLVGSRHNCHLHLLSRQISKAHAAILRTETGLIVRDLASRTHVIVNGQPVREVSLKTGDELQIGPFKFQIRLPAGTRNPAARTLPPVLVDVKGIGLPVAMSLQTLLIGRKPDADIPLVEPSVSTCHAIIFEMDSKRWVRDLGSRTGTFVNGRQVKTTELGVGDEVRIGETTMRLILADAPAASEAAVVDDASSDSVVAGHTDLSKAFSQNAPAPAQDDDDEFESFVGTAPLEPEEPIPAQANEPETSSESGEVDLSIVDLDAEMNSPADTARLPVEREEKRKRPATPHLADSVEDHVDIDDQDQRMLVDGAIMAEKLSSSATHADLGEAAAEAMELAGQPPAGQSLAVSSADVIADEPIDKATPVGKATPVAPTAKDAELSPRAGWRKKKLLPEPLVAPLAKASVVATPVEEKPPAEKPVAKVPAPVVAPPAVTPAMVTPAVEAKVEIPPPVEPERKEPVAAETAKTQPITDAPIEIVETPLIERTPVEADDVAPLIDFSAEDDEESDQEEVGGVELSPSALGALELEPVFDELEMPGEEEEVALHMDFDVQVSREPEPAKKRPSAKPEKKTPLVEPQELDLSGLKFSEPAEPELVEPVEQSPIVDVEEEESAAASAPAPLVNLGTRPLEIPPTPSMPARSNRRAPIEETPVAQVPTAEPAIPAPVAPAPVVASPIVAAPVSPAPVVPAPVIAAAAVSELISQTEPSPEAAQALEPVVLADAQTPPAVAEDSGSLTDTSFGRAVEEFTGDSLGPIVEAKSEPVAPAPAPVVPPPVPVAAPPVPITAAVPPVVPPPAPVKIEPVASAPQAAPEPAGEPEVEPQPIFAKAPAAAPDNELPAQPLIDAELLAEAPHETEQPFDSALPVEQEDAVLDDLLQGAGASAGRKTGAPMFSLIGQAQTEADQDAEDEYESESDEPVDQSDQAEESDEQEVDEDAGAPIFRNPVIRLPAPSPRTPHQVSASTLEPEAVATPVNFSHAPQTTSLDDILAWGTQANYIAGRQLNLPELPTAPEHFGKVGVSFGEAELRVDSNTRAPFEIVQSQRRAIEDQPAPVFQVQPQAPKQKVIRPLSDKSRRPRPIRGITQRRPKAVGPKPIGLPEPLQEPEPVVDPTIGSFSPVFGATLPESFGEGATVFGGLSMSPVREIDVFSQMSRSTIPIDPFTGATPEDIMQEAARPQQKPGRKRGVLQPSRRPPNIAPMRTGPGAQAAGSAAAPIPAESLTPALGAEDRAVDMNAAEQVLSGAPANAKAEGDTGMRPTRAPVVAKGLPPRVDPATRGVGAAAATAGGQPAYPVMKKRRRWLSTPWLILAMLMTTAIASVATFMLSPVRTLVVGEMKYLNLDHLNHTQRNEFFNISYMGNPPQARVLDQLYTAAAQHAQFEGLAPGFLADPVQYSRLINAPDTVKWPTDGGDTMQFAMWTTDPAGDAARIKAVLAELYLANTRHAGGDTQSAINSLNDQIKQVQEEVDRLDRQIADAEASVAAGVSPEQLAKLESDRDAADKVHADAYATLIKAQQDLERARQDAMAGQTADPAATSQPAVADDASSDPQLADAEKRLADYSRRYDAAKKYSADEAERNRKALEASIDEFKSNMADVQQLVKDNPSLQQYLESAQKLQDYVQKISGDMLDREQRDVDNLLDLKRFVDEQIERQRNDRYDNDKELSDLRVQLASVERQANAASEQGYTKEATDKAAEQKQLQDKIDARKTELAKEPALASASARLADQITLQQKQLVSDREDNDKAMKQLEQDMAQNAPAVSNLPKDQQQVAEKMSRDVDAMNNARKIYSESLAARDEETNEDLKALQQTVQKYAAEVDDRKKELALANDHKLTQDQVQERQAVVAQKQSDYDTAKAAEETALADSGAKYLAATRAELAVKTAKSAQMIADAARIDRGEKQADLEAKKSALATKQADLDKIVSAKEPVVNQNGSADTRALYTMAVGFSVIAFFSMLIVGSHLAQARHPQPREPVAPTDADPETAPDPDPSLAGAMPDPVFGGGNNPHDLHALEADGDEDVDPIVA